MAGKTQYYTIQSIVKTFEVIETMAMQPQWELASLSRQTNLPKTTVHRILLTLEEMGYVSQEKERGNYVLTLKIANLGNRIVNNIDLISIARPYCEELRDTLDETVNLCTLSGTEMIVMDRQQSKQLLRQDSVVGSSFSCFYSASGKAYMSSLEEDEIAKVLDKIVIEAKGKITGNDIRRFREELAEAHTTCIAYDHEEVFSGVRCVASPIFDRHRKVVATIGISAPSVRLQDEMLEKVAASVRNAAEQISKRLGAPFYPGTRQ